MSGDRSELWAEQSTASVLTKENDSEVVMDSTALRCDINTYFQGFYVHITRLYTFYFYLNFCPLCPFCNEWKNIRQLTLNRFIICLRKKRSFATYLFQDWFWA